MKRIWSLFAVLALLCALTIPALAAAGGERNVETPETLSEVEESDEVGANGNTVKLRKIWAVAALIGVACLAARLAWRILLQRRRTTWPNNPRRRGRSAPR